MRVRYVLGVYIFVIAYLYKLRFIKAENWSYAQQDAWPSLGYPQCGGVRQSPIDISSESAVIRLQNTLEFLDYDSLMQFSFKNKIHTVNLIPPSSGPQPRLKASWLSNGAEYILEEIHFHWGNGRDIGSEHKIDGEGAKAEMHMVHRKKGYTDDDVVKNGDSLVVIGVFLDGPEEGRQINKDLQGTEPGIEQVSGSNEVYSPSMSYNPIRFLPQTKDKFYSYLGSLTTPPCYEVVTWIVMRDPVHLDQDFITSLAHLQALHPGEADAQYIGPNHRVTMPLLGRQVFASFNHASSGGEHGRGHRIRLSLSNIFQRISATIGLSPNLNLTTIIRSRT